MADSLLRIRQDWELNLVPLTVIDEQKTKGRVLVILEDALKDIEFRYHCHRYFKGGDEWHCSVDGQNVPLANVFSWLNDPKAATARKVVVPEPVPIPEDESVV